MRETISKKYSAGYGHLGPLCTGVKNTCITSCHWFMGDTSAPETSQRLQKPRQGTVRQTSLFIGAIPNQVGNSQTSRFVSVPGQNPEISNRGDSVVLRLQSVMMADVWWCRSGPGIGYSLKSSVFNREWNVADGSARFGTGTDVRVQTVGDLDTYNRAVEITNANYKLEYTPNNSYAFRIVLQRDEHL